jgi:hypothetical protein
MLRAETDKVWNFLRLQTGMNGFVLVGGSALALRISHRFSEDLDVAFSKLILPSSRLDALARSFGANGFDIVHTDDPAALFEFEAAGQNLRDYQQDFLVNGKVKLSFFTADEALTRVLSPEESDTIRIGSLEELFASKALVCASRSTTRDWFDMQTLIQNHNFSVADIHAVFERVGNPLGFSIAMQRMCSGRVRPGDPGLEPIIGPAPSTEELAEFFRVRLDEFETLQAAKIALERLEHPNKLGPSL